MTATTVFLALAWIALGLVGLSLISRMSEARALMSGVLSAWLGSLIALSLSWTVTYALVDIEVAYWAGEVGVFVVSLVLLCVLARSGAEQANMIEGTAAPWKYWVRSPRKAFLLSLMVIGTVSLAGMLLLLLVSKIVV